LKVNYTGDEAQVGEGGAATKGGKEGTIGGAEKKMRCKKGVKKRQKEIVRGYVIFQRFVDKREFALGEVKVV